MSNLLVQNIKHTNGTTAQTIDSSGRVLTPSVPCFHVYNDSQNFSSTSVSKWEANVAVINNGSNFDLSNNRFTAPVAGHYFMAWHALFRNVASGFRVWWYKNGAINTNPSDTAASDIYVGYPSGHETTGAMSGIFNLSVGDYIEVYYQSGGAGDIYGDDNMHNGWTGHLIG
tara:strand:+ start:21 stop:533 length:513 start_codon:yes stop_codon:yes gene_type:complete